MKKKRKLNKKKFLSRIILLIIILIAMFLFTNSISDKKVDNDFELTLIVDKQDVTENLSSNIYIDKDGILYMSMEDIKNIFDENIYYEESTGKIITTYGTKVAAIDVKNNTIELNTATVLLSTGIIDYGFTYYIPISEINNIYNIEVITSNKVAIVLSLYKELVTVNTTKKISLKEKTGIFSNTIQKLEEGKEIIFIENSEKEGWIKVLTYDGKIGYIKEKNVSEKNYKRINMEEEDFTSKTVDLENSIEIGSERLTNDELNDFNSRKKIIDDVIEETILAEKYTVNINLDKVDIDEKKLERFIIELEPRLKEIGGNIVITNNNQA